jgi:hypothetical protein
MFKYNTVYEEFSDSYWFCGERYLLLFPDCLLKVECNYH